MSEYSGRTYLEYDSEHYAVGRPEKSRIWGPGEVPYTISIEGSVGSGKSYFIQLCRDKCNSIDIISEPIEQWKSLHGTGRNLLREMYRDPQRNAFGFQVFVQQSNLERHLKWKEIVKPRIIERSLGSKLFAEAGFINKHLSLDEALILKGQREFHENTRAFGMIPNLIVYLRTQPQTCLDRINKRGRKEEEGMNLSYLSMIHDLHERWLHYQTLFPPNVEVMEVDSDFNLEHNPYGYVRSVEEVINRCLPST